MGFFRLFGAEPREPAGDPAGAAEKVFLDRLDRLVVSLLNKTFPPGEVDRDEIAGRLTPILNAEREERLRFLHGLADIWVAQTGPAKALSSLRVDMTDVGRRMAELTRAADDMLTAINEVGETTEAVVRDSESLRERVDEGGRSVERATTSMGAAADSVTHLSSRIAMLAESFQQIAGIVKAIEDIAGQTNLLALNATIEAARAGEAGKGFAVVAGEVKALSNQTARATDDIRHRIETARAVVEEIDAAMARTVETVKGGADSVEVAGETIDVTRSAVDSVTRRMASIASIVEEQAATTRSFHDGVRDTAARAESSLLATGDLAASLGAVAGIIQPLIVEFGKNPDDRTLIQLARVDHAGFKKRVFDAVAGSLKLRPEDVSDHHSCRFGKWYEGDRDSRVKGHEAFRRIDDPHKRVHDFGREAVRLINAGDLAGAVAAAAKMDAASTEVFARLDELAF